MTEICQWAYRSWPEVGARRIKNLIDCVSKQSYGGVAKLNVQNAELADSGYILKVPFIKSYAKVPHCFIGENQLEDKLVVLQMHISVTIDSVSLYGLFESIDSSFTMLCFGVMSWNS